MSTGFILDVAPLKLGNGGAIFRKIRLDATKHAQMVSVLHMKILKARKLGFLGIRATRTLPNRLPDGDGN